MITASGVRYVAIDDINDRGRMTGALIGNLADSQYYNHAFLHSNGQIQDLGAIGGYFGTGLAINNHGHG
jgi:probable HAF family extracellular repeat protein